MEARSTQSWRHLSYSWDGIVQGLISFLSLLSSGEAAQTGGMIPTFLIHSLAIACVPDKRGS